MSSLEVLDKGGAFEVKLDGVFHGCHLKEMVKG